jgi:amino acid adenylation domain-containing protein
MRNTQNAPVQLGAGLCLPDLMARGVAERPGAVAVACAGQRLTYRELARRSDQLARGVRAKGIGPGDLVGIALTPSLDLVVAVLGIMKAGAAYVAVDPSYPAERIRFILADSGARTAVVDGSADLITSMMDGEAYTVGQLAFSADLPDSLPPVDPDQLCYLIYTSGSTGRPKGAMNRHAGVVHTMLGLAEAVGIDHTDRVLQASSLNFDLSVIEIFTSLLSGATLVVPTAAERGDPAALLDLLAREQVTVWSSTPALLRPVTDTASRRGSGLPASLRTVLLAGDRFPPAMVATLAELGPDIRAFNVAGVTEVSCCSTVYEVRKEDAERDSVPWGGPLPGHALHVLDDRRQPVPAGEPGELYLGGVAVGTGYWNRPDLTGERYLPDPFSDTPGALMYKTGDLVRHPDGGELEFLGRLDTQIKVRGLRVELGELESVLEQHPDVRQAVVVARQSRVGESTLVGFVVPMPGKLLAPAECRRHLAGSVPRHSVPSQFYFLSGLPLLPNGKIDRNALPLPEETEPRPATAAEGEGAADLLPAVLTIWREVLGTPHVSRHHEFFELGGHSLHAMEIVARVREDLGVPTGLAALFDHPTPAMYAAHLSGATDPPG